MIEDEHFIPKLGLDLESYIEVENLTGTHHLIRYVWAIKVIRDIRTISKVLDVACGSGYGSYMIAQELPSLMVVGTDYDKKAILYAREKYALPNLRFIVGDVTLWEETIGSDVYDCITSFDTIEHVSHREIMFANLVGHLKKDGYLLLSTPCGSDRTDLEPDWEYHRIEYSAASFYDFLRRYFQRILRPDGLAFPHLEVFEKLEGTGIDYLLRLNPVICEAPIVIDNPYKQSLKKDNL